MENYGSIPPHGIQYDNWPRHQVPPRGHKDSRQEIVQEGDDREVKLTGQYWELCYRQQGSGAYQKIGVDMVLVDKT